MMPSPPSPPHLQETFSESFDALLKKFHADTLQLYQQCRHELAAVAEKQNVDGHRMSGTPLTSPPANDIDLDLENSSSDNPQSNSTIPTEADAVGRAGDQKVCVVVDDDPCCCDEVEDTIEPASGSQVLRSSGTKGSLTRTHHQKLMDLEHIPKLVDRFLGRETISNMYEKLIFGNVYNMLVTFAIILQGAALGVEVQIEMNIQHDRINGKAVQEHPLLLVVLNDSLLVFFLFEVSFRVVVLRKRFFFPSDSDAQGWNVFDFIVALACIPEFFRGVFGQFPFVHALRLLRVIRVLRVARNVSSLRKMVFALLHCMTSLVWLVALMFLLLYMFSLVFMQGAALDMQDMNFGDSAARLLAKKSSSSIEEVPHPYEQFSNIAKAMQTLFLCITGDADWDANMKALMDSNWFYKCVGFFFSVFFLFGFMNVATGLFVDKAMQIASQDREMLIKEVSQKEAEEMEAMRSLFQAADMDGDGDLTIHELHELVAHPDVRSWLAATSDLDIIDEFDAVTRIMDPSGKGYVTADDFYNIIGRFKGSAKSKDTTLLLMEARLAHRSFEGFRLEHKSSLEKAISHLERRIPQSPGTFAVRENSHNSI